MSKGAGGSQIAILAVFLVSILFTFQTVDLTGAFATELTDSVSDLDRIAQTKSTLGLYLYNHVPMGAAYSVHRASYQLGQSSGGVKWGKGNTHNYAEIYKKLQEKASQKLNSDYSIGRVMRECNINEPEYDITLWSEPRQNLKGVVFTSSDLNITCKSRDNTETMVSKRDFKVYFNATDNRYLVLAKQSVEFYKKLESQWNSTDIQDSYTGSSKACGYYDYEAAESEAGSQFRSDLAHGFNSARDSYPSAEGVVEKKASFSSSYTVTSESTSQGKCCANNCTKRYKIVDTTIDPDKASATTTYRDSKYRIPVEGWKHLKFTVENYFHSFD